MDTLIIPEFQDTTANFIFGKRKLVTLLCLAIVSITSILASFIINRSYFGYVLAIICLCWILWDPYIFIVLVLPSLMVFADVPSFVGTNWSVLRVIMILVIPGLMLHPGRIIRGIKKIPKYLMISWLVLLLIYTLSGIYNGFSLFIQEKMIGQFLRFGILIIVFVSIYALENPKLLFFGLLFQGLVMLFSGLVIWYILGSYMAIRSIGIGYTGGNSLLFFSSFGVAYASLSVTAGLACIGLGQVFRKLRFNILFYFLGILIIFSSLMSSRRSAVVAIILAYLLMVVFERNKYSVFITLVIIIVTIPLVKIGYFDQFFSQRESILSEFSGGGTGRLGLIQYGINEWKKSPYWGYGPGSQPAVYQSENGFSHNTIISALLEGGIFAVFPVTIILIGLVFNVIIITRKLSFTNIKDLWPSVFLTSLANIIVLALISGDIFSLNNGVILIGILSGYMSRIDLELMKVTII